MTAALLAMCWLFCSRCHQQRHRQTKGVPRRGLAASIWRLCRAGDDDQTQQSMHLFHHRAPQNAVRHNVHHIRTCRSSADMPSVAHCGACGSLTCGAMVWGTTAPSSSVGACAVRRAKPWLSWTWATMRSRMMVPVPSPKYVEQPLEEACFISAQFDQLLVVALPRRGSL